MYYYYIFSLRVGGRVFFFPPFCGHHLATIKKKACNSYKGFFFLKGIPQICQILRKEQFEIVIYHRMWPKYCKLPKCLILSSLKLQTNLAKSSCARLTVHQHRKLKKKNHGGRYLTLISLLLKSEKDLTLLDYQV